MEKFAFSVQYEASLRAIEDFIFHSTGDIRLAERFLDEHDQALTFVANNPEAAAFHAETGDRSWLFGNGKYRLFFLVDPNRVNTLILLTDIIDNRQINLNIYPGNSLPTFDIDD